MLPEPRWFWVLHHGSIFLDGSQEESF